MSDTTEQEHLDRDFDEELGLDDTTPNYDLTAGQKTLLIAIFGFFALLAMIHILLLILVLFFGLEARFVVGWAATFSSLWSGIFNALFFGYLAVLICTFVGTKFAPELLHPLLLNRSKEEKMLAFVPLLPFLVLHFVNRGLVSYLAGLI